MPGRKLVIAVDCDDVLVQTAQNIVDNYNSLYGTSLNLGHMYKPASLDTWGTDDDDVAIERVNEFLQSDEHARIVPDAEAVVAVRLLAERHELHLITGRAEFLTEITKRMLDDHFSGCFTSIEHTNYIVSSASTVRRRSKGEVCQIIGADMLIDDHMEHGKNVLAADTKRVIVFGNYPWNQEESLPEGMVRCADWAAVLEEVEQYAAR